MSLSSRPSAAMVLFWAMALAAVAIPVGASAAPPSVDCSRATEPVELAICSTPALGALDRRIAERYADLVDAMDDDSARALRQDQRAFNDARDQAAVSLDGANLIEQLTERLTQRADFLDQLQDNPLEGVVGRWSNLQGEVTVVQWATGVLTFEAQTVDPVDGRWVCEAHGDGEWTGAEEASFEIRTDEDIKWSLTATRAGATLRLEESATGDSASAPFCGSGGTISGTYFRIPSLDSSR